ncbi:uncharacterized protein LACBIDRAFT_318700 [Laccaria bicolor S238N-H82]|uniref:Predicted protein n=1 Tax=Laccaria bicolor (strain S238N-H82 / ATCC MYA-4686) TaxID=486041 RepID=B0D6U8_LACBS|nr:uncharacterized protein LACBIDRAFT_318700 [Laccaria bicolor S238N-H82]EDR09286.1 predicted protein [Laccaria bicolor S238N-H82]|eukprot:XP_001879635.1 predicted protein [Laccaria bicolor S238N-H82]
MCRSYAVVVYIGNMLESHYVAYTALPSQSPGADSQRHTESTTMENGATFKPAQSKPDHKWERQWANISDMTVRLGH